MNAIFKLSAIASVILFSSCATIIQDEVAVKRTLGKLNKEVYHAGFRVYNPFISRLIYIPISTINLEINVGLPSKEGLTVQSDISILYKIKTSEVQNILRYTGLNYQNVLILPVFRSASADICSEFDAKDMHSSKRSKIENKIRERMMEVLESKGFVIEAVLLKSISLPQGLSRAIEEKLQSEQEAQRMEFLKDRERKEAERKVLQAEGDKKSKIIAAEGVKQILELEALKILLSVLLYKRKKKKSEKKMFSSLIGIWMN
jgi:regulator of protease activity HflC (stomatin/prohibitin superfamily)